MTRIGGPLRRLMHLNALQAEEIVAAPVGEVGRTRAAHVLAMIERAFASSIAGEPGYFTTEVRERLDVLLKDAHLQEEEAHFRDILKWSEPDNIRRELRSNLLRLFRKDEQHNRCIELALDVHVTFDLYMRHHNGAGYKSHVAINDVYEREPLRLALGRTIMQVPELAMHSALRSTVAELAEAA